MIQTKKRSIYLDVLKVLACFLVCYNHCEAFNWFLYMPSDGSFLTLFAGTMDILSKMNVPLYFTVTGALLLGKEESYSQVLKKRFSRFLAVLAVATLLKYLLSRPERYTLLGYLRALTSGELCSSYWFLYQYMGFLLILPLLQRIAKILRRQDMAMLVVLKVAVDLLLPAGNAVLLALSGRPFKISGNLQMPFSSNILFYPLLGYFLANLPKEKLDRKVTALSGAVLAGSTAMALAVVCYHGSVSGFTQEYLSISVSSAIPAVFLLVRRCFEGRKIPEWLEKGLIGLSGSTLGIYLGESFLWGPLSGPGFNILYMLPPVPRFLGNGVWCAVIMILGCCITWVIRRIPGGKKLL